MTNRELVAKYKNDKILLKTYYTDSKGINIDGVVVPLKIDNRQEYSVIDDQGITSECTCYSICGICEALIWKRTGKLINLNAEHVYALAKSKDGNINMDGTYLENAIDAAIELGGFSSELKNLKIGYFRNTGQSINQLKTTIMHLLHKYSFLHAGFAITSGWMSCTNDNYMITHTTQSLGGHAVVICGGDQTGVYIANSWGTKWGAKGFAILPWDLVQRELMYICYLQNCFDNLHD